MLKIDFYVIPGETRLSRLQQVCCLTETAYTQQSIYIRTTDRSEAELLDQLLWTYRDDSFIPHGLYHKDNPAPPFVQIGYDATPEDQRDILINLGDDIPSFYQQFSRIIEIVSNNASIQASARTRYRFYREQAYDIQTYKL